MVTGPNISNYYVLIGPQTALTDKDNKCEYLYNTTTTLDITYHYQRSGPTGSRVGIDDITDGVRAALLNLTLDAGSGLTVQKQTFDLVQDFTEPSDSEIVYRTIARLELQIN